MRLRLKKRFIAKTEVIHMVWYMAVLYDSSNRQEEQEEEKKQNNPY
jgi:hypothetical protein